jgi:hypothetical protein
MTNPYAHWNHSLFGPLKLMTLWEAFTGYWGQSVVTDPTSFFNQSFIELGYRIGFAGNLAHSIDFPDKDSVFYFMLKITYPGLLTDPTVSYRIPILTVDNWVKCYYTKSSNFL